MVLSSRCLSFLNGSTRNLNNGREHFYGSKKKKQKLGFPPEFQAWQKGKPFQGEGETKL